MAPLKFNRILFGITVTLGIVCGVTAGIVVSIFAGVLIWLSVIIGFSTAVIVHVTGFNSLKRDKYDDDDWYFGE